MANRADETWLQPGAYDRINPIWRDRMLVILEDLVGLEGLRYALLLDSAGKNLSEIITSSGPVKQLAGMPDPTGYVELANSAHDTFLTLGESAPTHLIDDDDEGLVFIGSVDELVLVAAFSHQTTRGAVVMRLSKRIRHLKSLEKSRQRAALYV